MENIAYKRAYKNVVLWKGKYLLLQDRDFTKVYVVPLDGSNKTLLFENNLVEWPLQVSPDQKFLACPSIYHTDKKKLLDRIGRPPNWSIFIMNLEDKTYTYYMTNEIDSYQKNFCWYTR